MDELLAIINEAKSVVASDAKAERASEIRTLRFAVLFCQYNNHEKISQDKFCQAVISDGTGSISQGSISNGLKVLTFFNAVASDDYTAIANEDSAHVAKSLMALVFDDCVKREIKKSLRSWLSATRDKAPVNPFDQWVRQTEIAFNKGVTISEMMRHLNTLGDD
jgi:hypothetical protein